MEKESFIDKAVREATERMTIEIQRQEDWHWSLRSVDAKFREDIKNGKPIYFTGFINKLTNG